MSYPRFVALAFVLGSSPLLGQANDPLPAGTYSFDVSVPVTRCNFDGSGKSITVHAPALSRFYYLQSIVAGNSNDVVIQFLNFKAASSFRTFNVDSTDAGLEPKYFCLPRTTFERFTSKAYATGRNSWELAAGALILPVKLRPGGRTTPFDFSKDVTIGTTAGGRIRMHPRRDVYQSFLLGVGISSATLTPQNTGGSVTELTDRAALTWTIGTMLEVEKFQFGLFLGQDRISQPNQGNWVYQGKTWWALGLGYSLFGASAPKEAKGNP